MIARRVRAIVRLGWLGVALLAAAPACRKHAPSAAETGPQTPPPDLPRPFGPRCVWLAVRGSSPIAVARALGLRNPAPSGWTAGVAAAYAGGVFVTPPIDGWVLAASTQLPDAGSDAKHPDKATPLLARLSSALGEVQYFGSYDEIGWSAWARFRDGVATRKLAVLVAQDAVIWNEGTPTPEERALGLVDGDKKLGPKLDEKSVFAIARAWSVDADQKLGPKLDEKSVFAIARAWSVDPSALESRHLGPSLGVVGSL